eukprot:scaffold3007_cov144-Skeletonema_dohrnii-CCMP3373.AAC.10
MVPQNDKLLSSPTGDGRYNECCVAVEASSLLLLTTENVAGRRIFLTHIAHNEAVRKITHQRFSVV